MPIIVGSASQNTIIRSDRVTLPSYADPSSLPSAAATANGSLSYSISDNKVYFKSNDNTWVPVSPKLGTAARPAGSAEAILDAGDSTGDGVYYIKSSSGTIQVYCDMSNGGYMLVAKLDSTQNDEWMYNGSYWSASSPLNETACQNVSDGTDSINRLYYEYSLRVGFRICLGSVSNGLVESNKTGAIARNFFTGSQSSSQNGRSAFLSWFQTGTGQSSSNFDNQPNCNTTGFNVTNASSAALRYGITMNNEGDCSSNDSGIGLGAYTNGQTTPSAGLRNCNAGGFRWNPDARYTALGLIFVK